MNPNPYESVSSAASDSGAEPQSFAVDIYSSRTPIAFGALILFALAMTLTAVLSLSFILRNPDTGNLLVFDRVLWHIVHFLRVCAFSYIGVQLWQYQKAIKSFALHGSEMAPMFATIHNRVWRHGVTAMACILVLAILDAFWTTIPGMETLLGPHDLD